MTDQSDHTSRCARCALPYQSSPHDFIRFELKVNGKFIRTIDLCDHCAGLGEIGEFFSPAIHGLVYANREANLPRRR